MNQFSDQAINFWTTIELTNRFHVAVRLFSNKDHMQQDGWKTQDGGMTKKCGAILWIPGLSQHFCVIVPS